MRTDECVPTCWTQVVCRLCHMVKKPVGRDAPMEMAGSLCDHECPGYKLDPQPPHLWPEEAP